ncbi:MAG: hypothetical protein ABFD50_09955, partial [Smithella sp.]
KLHLTKGARELLTIFDDLEKEIAPILQKAEDKIVALKKRYVEEVTAVKKKTNQEVSGNNQLVYLNLEQKMQKTAEKAAIANQSKEKRKKNICLLKSVFYLFILPLMDIAYRIEEEAEILMYF